MEQYNPDKPNPYMQIPNPWDEYKKSLEDTHKQHPEAKEFARLCYEIFFMQQEGKRLLQILENQYLMRSLVHPYSDNAPNLALYWTGYTDLIKTFRSHALMHKEEITAI